MKIECGHDKERKTKSKNKAQQANVRVLKMEWKRVCPPLVELLLCEEIPFSRNVPFVLYYLYIISNNLFFRNAFATFLLLILEFCASIFAFEFRGVFFHSLSFPFLFTLYAIHHPMWWSCCVYFGVCVKRKHHRMSEIFLLLCAISIWLSVWCGCW